jgi:hypothetical protein
LLFINLNLKLPVCAWISVGLSHLDQRVKYFHVSRAVWLYPI